MRVATERGRGLKNAVAGNQPALLREDEYERRFPKLICPHKLLSARNLEMSILFKIESNFLLSHCIKRL